jgi:hypothetical protein
MMGEKNLGTIFIEGFVRAIPWALVFSVALVLSVGVIMNMLRQDVKEAMEYGAQTVVHETTAQLLEDEFFINELLPRIKQNVKEAIQYTITEAADQELFHASGQSGRK